MHTHWEPQVANLDVYSHPEQGGKDCGRNIQSYGECPVLKSHGERAQITNNDSWPFTHNIQYYLGHSARLFNKVTGRTGKRVLLFRKASTLQGVLSSGNSKPSGNKLETSMGVPIMELVDKITSKFCNCDLELPQSGMMLCKNGSRPWPVSASECMLSETSPREMGVANGLSCWKLRLTNER